MDLAKLETTIRKYAPKFIYTMPNYHNPTGIVMSLEKRKKLLELAEGIVFPSSKRTPSGIFDTKETGFPACTLRIGTGR